MSTSQRGFTLVELLIVTALVAVLSALAIHHVLAAKAVSNEASAVGTLRALNSAQITYAGSCAQGYFATTFNRLVEGRFASPDMNVSPKSGYIFEISSDGANGPRDCEGDETRSIYYASGVPASSLSGQRAFATNQASTIWQDTAGTAPSEPFTITGTVSPLESRSVSR